MSRILQMFLLLFKSNNPASFFIFCISACIVSASIEVSAKCKPNYCNGNGICINGVCDCYDGWQGSECQFCAGKIRPATQRGIIHDGVGNYSLNAKCSWLIDAPNASITLHLEEFVTECGWDHLYIFDGDSVDSPLLAAFSGVMYKANYSIRKIPEVIATSGYALVHFHSDDYYNMSGFNLTYRLNACPSKISGEDCSGNGVCVDGICICQGQWTGRACHIAKCPNNCGAAEGHGHCEPNVGCNCSKGYVGNDCNQMAESGYWETVIPPDFTPPGSASHGAAIWEDSMYIIAGESYHRAEMLYVYNLTGNTWETTHLKDSPLSRYAHSTILYTDKIYIYGGVVDNRGSTSELWAFDISAKTWENITVKAACNTNSTQLLRGPLKSAGHTATLVTNSNNQKADKMILIFGYSPHLGYLNTVQEYYFGSREWCIVNTTGFPVKGGYGHSAAWDPLTRKIYVYGGVVSENESTQILSKSLYAYEPETKLWTFLTDGPSARFLHTSTFVSEGLMLVFGGNTHNDTSHSSDAKCYSSDMLAYDVVCDSWYTITVPKDMISDLARFGHSAVLYEGSLYLYGGFDGQMLSDILKYTPGTCIHLHTPSSCLNNRTGVKCVWDHREHKCVAIQMVPNLLALGMEDVIKRCPEMNRSLITLSVIQNEEKCKDCTISRSNGVSCGNAGCTYHDKCRDNVELFRTDLNQCPTDFAPVCKQFHTCNSCSSHAYCKWKFEIGKCETLTIITESTDQIQCPKVCFEYTSCLNCTKQDCVWCQNENRCVEKNAYTTNFPYGQCREWTFLENKCRRNEKSQCNSHSTCAQCRDDPACGWCDDGSKTGLGKCLASGYKGPNLLSSYTTCPVETWHFTSCPVCQCNGHSSCKTNTSICLPCGNLTMGIHCENCIPGYWGNPINGGTCNKCECNGKASQCNSVNGKCYCTTKGAVGDHCEKCDQRNQYFEDPDNKGNCYYNLETNYQYTFNLSKIEERHFTQINFRHSPTIEDRDLVLAITCPEMAKINITVRNENSKEKTIFAAQNCYQIFKTTFAKSQYNFRGKDNVTSITFYVYVYDFGPPVWIRIFFAQYPPLQFMRK